MCIRDRYYDEIKLYFLHTYLYETLYFAKLRDFKPSYAFYKELEKTVITEVPDYDESTYSALIPKQMELYRMIGEGMTEEKFGGYWERLWGTPYYSWWSICYLKFSTDDQLNIDILFQLEKLKS